MIQIDDRWAYQPGEHFRYNAGVICDADRAFLIDPGMTGKEIHDLQGFLANTGRNCAGIILTHFHWDHILGANNFGHTDIFAHQQFPGEQRTHLQGTGSAIEKWAASSNEKPLKPEAFPIPNHLLEDGNRLQVGETSLLILHTPGHTSDHISIFDESRGVLWAGDILSNAEIPFISGSILAFLGTMEKLSELKITAIIPGHGSPTREQAEAHKRVVEDLEYLHELKAAAEMAVHKGATLEETVKLCRDIPIRNPQDNMQAHVWNIESAYKELGGMPSIKPVGWEKE